METKEYRAVPFDLKEVKAVDGGWEFTGYAATFGNVDHGGDVFLRTAFDRTLADRKTRPLLWQHDLREPIGVEKSLKVDDKGLLGTWSLIDTARGTDAYKLLKAGGIGTMSVGYLTRDAEYDNDGVRILKEVELLENSLVSIPMNDRAVVTGVKFRTDQPFHQSLQEVTDALTAACAEAKALKERREASHRDLPERHVEAMRAALASVKALSDELEALVSPPEQVKTAGGLALRLELARRRLRMRGVPLEQTA